MGEHCWRYIRCIHTETVDPTTPGIMILPCDYALDIIVFFVVGLWSCLIDNIPLVMHYIRNITIYRLHYNLFYVVFCFYVCICLLCNVVCMHNVHTTHIFIVCNSLICTNTFNILAILV